MNRSSRILMLLAALLLLAMYFVPLWRITLDAPQYPDGITMYIWINKITGDSEYTLQNINILNHYVGMKYIEPEAIPELQYFPYIVGSMVILGLLAAFPASRNWRLAWFLALVVLGVLGMYDFYLWEYDYGHNLSPTAPIKVPGMAYQPPLFGSKMLLNFKASSYPHWGGMAMLLSIICAMGSLWMQRKSTPDVAKKNLQPASALALLLLLGSCSTGPQAITYGSEGCQYCKMTIIDTRYGAEWVSTKGKIHKFDAVECLINHLQSQDAEQVQSMWVTAFDNPGILVEAPSCKYLISSELPSPMGMNITAFSSTTPAQTQPEEYEGEWYTWSELQLQLSKIQTR